MVDEKWLFIKKPSYITNVNGRTERGYGDARTLIHGPHVHGLLVHPMVFRTLLADTINGEPWADVSVPLLM